MTSILDQNRAICGFCQVLQTTNPGEWCSAHQETTPADTCRYRESGVGRCTRPAGHGGHHTLAKAAKRMTTDKQIAALKQALTRCITSHCSNEKLFCGSCTPARELLAELGAPVPPRTPESSEVS